MIRSFETLQVYVDDNPTLPMQVVTNTVAWAYTVKATPATSAVRSFASEARSLIEAFLNGDISENVARRQFGDLVADNWIAIARQAWADGGRSAREIDNSRLAEQVSKQRGFVADLFERLAGQKQNATDTDKNPVEYADNVVDLWKQGLIGQYNTWKVATVSGEAVLLQWVLGATEKHCPTCAELAGGPPHTAIWYENRGYMPGVPGSATECGGYHCDCTFVDVDGNDFTLIMED